MSIRATAWNSIVVPPSPVARTVTNAPGFRPSRDARRCRTVSRAGEPSDAAVCAGLELQRQHAHVDEIAAVDALEALGDHRLDAEQQRALRRPVARRSRAVFLARDESRSGTPAALYFIAAS